LLVEVAIESRLAGADHNQFTTPHDVNFCDPGNFRADKPGTTLSMSGLPFRKKAGRFKSSRQLFWFLSGSSSTA
jgi:hypothetical protein